MSELHTGVNSPERLDVAIIGAGIIGLALARAFALQGREVVVFESERRVGTHSSSRNSEVIHSGIYYSTPLKAQLCVEGRTLLYEYCREEKIPHKKTGKLLVASSDEEIHTLTKLKKQGEVNRVVDLEWLEPADISELEPEAVGARGIFSPSTGIVDSDSLMKSLERNVVENNGTVVLNSPVLGGTVLNDGIELHIGDRDKSSFLCTTVINSAGLLASEVARSIEGVPLDTIPHTYLAKGHYFTMREKPFKHLVYPVPSAGGLGIHVTLDMGGNVRFGPDVSWVDRVDYGLDESRAASFYPAIRTYYPRLPDGSLSPGYTGIRPKLAQKGEPERDFMIVGPDEHRVPGLVNLFGIESPGLTASLALARHVSSMV